MPRMKILLADDSSISRDLLRRIIALEPGHELTQACDGEEAWQFLRDPSRRFDVGIFDVTMPRLDGIGLVERLRATPGLRELPVILCTAIHDRQTVERACLLSVSHYIVKPYTRALVLEKLHLIAAELVAPSAIEDPQTVAARLGVDSAAIATLVADVGVQIRAWLVNTRQARHRTDFMQLSIAANGLKGACLSVGLRNLARAFGAIEAKMENDFAAPHRDQFPVTPAEVALELQQIENELSHLATDGKAA
jgi:CheY-like chemotaxis protein